MFLRLLKLSLVTSLFLTTFTATSWAENGEIAYAYPIKNITIDGDLSDWPTGLKRYPVEREYSGTKEDFEAGFYIAYSVENKSIYVGLEVFDQSHIVDENGSWLEQDGHLFYVDPTHSIKGSGLWLFGATEKNKEIHEQEGSFDPSVVLANLDDVELKVTRSDTKTVYEWRIKLGDKLIPGRSIGLDLLIVDVDENEPGRAIVLWGKYFGKSSTAGRLGDVILVDPSVPLGTLHGKVRWAEGVDIPSTWTYKVRIISKSFPQLWVQTEVDEKGVYEVDLPAGDYTVSSPFLSYGPDREYRLKDDLFANATVKANQTTNADVLEWDIVPLPEFAPGAGFLFTYDESKEAEVDAFINAYMKHYHVPGLSVALVKDAKLVYHKTFGIKNILTEEPVVENTLFDVGSITKAVFAFAVNRMAERGEIDLDKPLYEYLPFEAIAHDERYKLITARHVLSHQTGFPNWGFGNLDIKFTPGTEFGYSGEGFDYLARVVVHLKKKSLEEIYEEEVLGPMGLSSNVEFTDKQAIFGNAAYGHNSSQPSGIRPASEAHAAYSMYTETKAFSNFMIALMNGVGLSQESYQEMLEPQVTTTWPDVLGSKVDYGLGFQLINTPYGKAYGHSGQNSGNLSLFEIYEEQKSGFLVFTNSESGHQFYNALREFLILGAL